MSFRPKPPLGKRLNTAHPLVRSLFRCWLMNEGGGTRMHDLTGRSRPAIATGISPGTITFSRDYLEFKTDDVMGMVTPDSHTFGDDDDWAFAVRYLLSDASNDVFFGSYNTSYDYFYNRPGTRARFKSGSADNDFSYYGSLGQQMDLVLNVKGSENLIEMYADGKFHDSVIGTANTALPVDCIGSAYNSSTYAFLGKIWYVYVWNRSLTVSEIQSLHADPYGIIKDPYPIELFGYVAAGTTLVVEAAVSAGTLDNVALTQAHTLAVQALDGAGAIDNVELSISEILSVAESLSAGTIDNIELTQKHILAVDALLSSGTLDAVNLVVSTLLVVSDLLSSGALNNTALTQQHVLTVAEVLSAGTVDSTVLTQKHILILNSLLSSGLIDTINFNIASGLIFITLTQAQEYTVALSEETEYGIALTETTEYNIALTETGGGER